MKKLTIISLVLGPVLYVAVMILNPLPASGSPKGDGGGKPIPQHIMQIAEKSCVKCHTEPGNFMALSHVNLSNWDKYSAEKQASKAKAMCKMVSKEKMPPKSFRKEHPKDVPTAEESKAICDWAESLQPPKK